MEGIGIGRGFLWQRAALGYDANDLRTELDGMSSGTCKYGSFLVPVYWESVGGRDLNWERIPLVEGQS